MNFRAVFFFSFKYCFSSLISFILAKIACFLTSVIILYLALKLVKKEKADFFKALGVVICLYVLQLVWIFVVPNELLALISYIIICFLVLMYSFDLTFGETLMVAAIYLLLSILIGFIIFSLIFGFSKLLIKLV
ncbi:MAG: hypothetical protein GXO42_01770 [bacterium]|nr:hypothetical protein [bacterium]